MISSWLQSRLFRKYILYFVALMAGALLVSGAVSLYFSYRETRAALVVLQQEKALGAAMRIEQFVEGIEQQLGWISHPPAGGDTLDQRYLDFLRLLRQTPAVTEVSWLDAAGREQIRVSRLAMDRLGSGDDRSASPAFRAPLPQRPYFSPVYFRQETEPYMTIALAASNKNGGVVVAEVNLKFVWDVISHIRIGESGYAYVVDRGGRLVSHPDISLALKPTNISWLPQVKAAIGAGRRERPESFVGAENRDGLPVLATYSLITSLGWAVLVEQPLAEAYAPLYASLARNGLLLLFGLVLSAVAGVLLARRMVTPIQALQTGAAQIGGGALDHRIDVRTGDELQDLAEQFNRMAAQLHSFYADLERKIEERTRQLEAANQAKGRFLAAASHDLRQPMHALGLFVGQLRERIREPETFALAGKVGSAVTALQELLDALLDISRLDAGVISTTLSDFRIGPLLLRLTENFAPQAERRNLYLRVVSSRLVVRGDPVLLERILLNLIANAIRYTERGGIVVGCRRRGSNVRVEVWDSGIGIAPEHQQAIFQEFYQVDNPERDRKKGLGLGLAIAARLARLLGGRIEMKSWPDRGSVFAVEVPRGAVATEIVSATAARLTGDSLRGALVLVVDDDALVRDAMATQLAHWGCEVITAAGTNETLEKLAQRPRAPDAIVCDYRLPSGETGIELIQSVRAAAGTDIPAALVTGDTSPERLREAKDSGFALLHKPVPPARLRALLEHLTAMRADVSVAEAARHGPGRRDVTRGG